MTNNYRYYPTLGLKPLNARPMTVESRSPLTLHFSILYLDQIPNLHFQYMKVCILKTFMNFFEN
jgi:hypothetical protein